MKSQQLRIIGGKHKRRTIRFASVDGLRPTPDRLRETLFNWLMHDISHARVLDVCAGSGALSWESISRGAAHVTLIEPSRKQVAFLKQAIDDLGCAEHSQLITQKAEIALKRLEAPFDIIFVDPPYAMNLWNNLLTLAFEQQLVKQGTLIYLEADKSHEALDISPDIMQQLELVKETQVGQIFAGLYQVQIEGKTEHKTDA